MLLLSASFMRKRRSVDYLKFLLLRDGFKFLVFSKDQEFGYLHFFIDVGHVAPSHTFNELGHDCHIKISCSVLVLHAKTSFVNYHELSGSLLIQYY